MARLTIQDLLPEGREDYEFGTFEPCASYSAALDQIVYLKEDVSSRADRVDQFLTILWHPHEERVVGIKIKGIRYLFECLRTESDKDVPEEAFLPLVKAIEFALKKVSGADLSAKLEQKRSPEWLARQRRYEIAKGVAGDVTFDRRKVLPRRRTG
jgi:hypothetical protein